MAYPNLDTRMCVRTLSTSRSLDMHIGKRSSPLNTGAVAVESDVTRELVFASMRRVTAPLAGMKIAWQRWITSSTSRTIFRSVILSSAASRSASASWRSASV